jgi:hypothetical protein
VWIPSLILRQDVQVQSLLDGYSRYTNHFVYLHQLFDSPWGYGLSVAGDQDGMSFSLGWSHVLIAVAASAAWMRGQGRLGDARWLWFFGLTAVIFCWMILPAAQPVWDRVQLLQYIAFPWRWLGPIAVCVAMLAGAMGPMIATLEKHRTAAIAAAMAALIVPNLSHLHPREFVDVDPSFWTPHEIASRGLEPSSLGEYRPRWAMVPPPAQPRPAEIVSGYATIQQTSGGPTSWSGVITAATPSTPQMPLAYFPEWQVRLDDAPVRAWPSDHTGLIQFEVPAGAHRVSVMCTRTPVLWFADGASALALLILALVGIVPRRSTRNRRTTREPNIKSLRAPLEF